MSRTVMMIVGLVFTPALLAFQPPATAPSTQPAAGDRHVTRSGLTIITVAPGQGSQIGDTVWVHYEGRLTDGTPFDSSNRNDPIPITLGQGAVIAGWEEGLLGMQVGEKRQLIIPPHLGFGESGKGKIPPNATLVFDVEMMGIRRG